MTAVSTAGRHSPERTVRGVLEDRIRQLTGEPAKSLAQAERMQAYMRSHR